MKTSQFSRGRVAMLLLVAVVCGVAAGTLALRAGDKQSVVMLARPVQMGQVITADDVTSGQVATDSVPVIAWASRSKVVGKTAVVGLVKGQLVTSSMVADHAVADPNSAQVGVVLKPGQYPGAGLSAGDTVMIVLLPETNSVAASSTDGSSSDPNVLAPKALVVSSSASGPDSGSSVVVTVQVPRSIAATLAAASSSGNVALVKVAA